MRFRDRKYHPRRVWRLARCAVRRYWPFSQTDFIAITGSCGKTNTTRFLGKILTDCAPTFVGIDNNHGKIILKNMLKLRYLHRFMVQETAVETGGDMARNVAVMRPNIGIVTTIGHDHYTSFRSLEATAAEKGVLVESLPPAGTAVLNADDPLVIAMQKRTHANVITYGCAERADLRATNIQATWPQRLSLTLTFQGKSLPLETELFGDLLLPSLLAAVAGALAVGISLEQCTQSLHRIEAFPRRMSIHRSPQGVWFINDTFKSPYWSVDKVVSLLQHAQAPRKSLIIGSFSDTAGSDSQKYRAVARRGLEVADRVIFVGEKARHVRKIITPELEKKLFAFDSFEQATRMLQTDSVQDELILLKSGARLHLERLIYGQSDLFNCWRASCPRKISCMTCENSGIA